MLLINHDSLYDFLSCPHQVQAYVNELAKSDFVKAPPVFFGCL